jgi:N-acyl-D-amino-acid deacylase
VANVDVLLKGGWVIDGSGGPPFLADVAVLDSVVEDVGRLDGLQADRVIDVTGLYVVPGFIDVHVHGDLMLLSDPVHLPALRQGVTTYILGQDGTAFAPASPSTMTYMRRYSVGFNGNPPDVDSSWSTVEEYLARFDRTTALNVAYLIPNGNVRLEVMGHDPRPSTADERKAMRRLVREGLDAGAVGLSTGLDYLPSRHADAGEIADLCKELVPDDGVYVTHMRAYGRSAPTGMSEVMEIVARSGVAAHISHFNGPADLLLPLIDEGRARGQDLTFDTYPYVAGSTILAMVALPPWVQEGGVEATLQRLSDPKVRQRLESEWFSATDRPRPIEGVFLSAVKHPDWQWAEGRKLTDAAQEAGLSVGDFVAEILLASDMEVGIVMFGGDRTDADVRAILRHPAHMAGSDGIFWGSKPHPRGWGAFARFLGHHTRSLGDYTWAEAVTHLSAHAARRYRLTDRGLVRPGYAADLAVFNPATVRDRSTYADGRVLAEGVSHVLVNGVPVLIDGEPTGATPGRALRRG